MAQKFEYILIDTAQVPEDDAVIELVQRGREVIILVDGMELMGNQAFASEEALSDLAFDHLTSRKARRVLIGGLGMGFTLASALARAEADTEIVVAELVPAIVKWNREHCGRAAGFPLRDARVVVHEGDVADQFAQAEQTWDVIVLDVDNGPRGLTRLTNGWLYTPEALRCAHRSLQVGGVLGVWSSTPNRTFGRRLEKAGFDIVTYEVAVQRGSSQLHTVWIGVKR